MWRCVDRASTDFSEERIASIFRVDTGCPLADFSTLKTEAIRSSETSADARSTQRHNTEYDIIANSDYFEHMQHPTEEENNLQILWYRMSVAVAE
jgi:hypothetical protein